ncbi:tyrosine-type recombinase/integrase [Vibrio vulnificus]|nr:tyrosine-type recombinase/integrase [Vibrio vulnificus]ELR8772489.1 tyrosine-type recombinase/integrase [Vibrio vulnificus]
MSKKRQIRIHLSTAVKRDTKELNQSKLRKCTIAGYKSCNNRILNHFEDKLVKDITADDIDKFANVALREAEHSKGKSYSDKTIRETVVRLEQIVEKHRRKGDIRNDPFAVKVKIHKGVGAEKTPPYTPAEIRALKEEADGSGIVEAIECMAETGLRGSELIALTHRNADISNSTLMVEKSITLGECNLPKTKYSARTLAITNSSRAYISEQLSAVSKGVDSCTSEICDITFRQGASTSKQLQDHFIFHNPNNGKNWKDIKELGRAAKPYFERAGVKFRGLSPLRHTFATEMRKRGFSYADIAEILGHTSEVITKSIYVFQSEIVRGQQTIAERNEVPLY